MNDITTFITIVALLVAIGFWTDYREHKKRKQ